MYLVIEFEDGVEVTYEADTLAICHDPYGLGDTSYLSGPDARRRPHGDYILVRGARLEDIQGIPTGTQGGAA